MLTGGVIFVYFLIILYIYSPKHRKTTAPESVNLTIIRLRSHRDYIDHTCWLSFTTIITPLADNPQGGPQSNPMKADSRKMFAFTI